jgi:hypothetical protein
MLPGYLPIRNGAYAGPVTEGNADVIVESCPSSRSAASAGE